MHTPGLVPSKGGRCSRQWAAIALISFPAEMHTPGLIPDKGGRCSCQWAALASTFFPAHRRFYSLVVLLSCFSAALVVYEQAHQTRRSEARCRHASVGGVRVGTPDWAQ
eukprot:1161654-Pelagomonas_calceolata.AAC.21